MGLWTELSLAFLKSNRKKYDFLTYLTIWKSACFSYDNTHPYNIVLCIVFIWASALFETKSTSLQRCAAGLYEVFAEILRNTL